MRRAGLLILAHYYQISLIGNFWVSISLSKISLQSRALPTTLPPPHVSFQHCRLKALPTYCSFYPRRPFPSKSLILPIPFGIPVSRMTWTDTRGCSEGWGFKGNKKDKAPISKETLICWVLIECKCIHLFFHFFFLFYHMEVLGPGVLNQSYSCWPTPQPWQHRILATSATYMALCGNLGTLTHCVRPGIKPVSLQRQGWVLNPLSHETNSSKWIHLTSTFSPCGQVSFFFLFLFHLIALKLAYLKIPRVALLLSEFNFILFHLYLCQDWCHDSHLYEQCHHLWLSKLPLGTVAESESSYTHEI